MEPGSWYSEQHERRERSTSGGRRLLKLPQFRRPEFDHLQWPRAADVINVRFQDYVTPQGALAMRTGAGQRFEGQIDPQNVLRGRVIGACVYDATWRRSA